MRQIARGSLWGPLPASSSDACRLEHPGALFDGCPSGDQCRSTNPALRLSSRRGPCLVALICPPTFEKPCRGKTSSSERIPFVFPPLLANSAISLPPETFTIYAMHFLDEIFFCASAEKSPYSKKGLSVSTSFLSPSFAEKPARKSLLFVEKIWYN